MYKVIGAVNTRAFRVMWILEELGQPFEILTVSPASDAAKEYNPLGKIPALLDGDVALTDSVAIMTYLADKHGGVTAPAGTPQRAKQDAMTNWLLDEFDATLWMAAKHSFVLPKDQRVPEIKPHLRSYFARQVDVFADLMAGEFAAGNTFSVPDILAVHCLNWAVGAKFEHDNDAVKDYAKRMRSRPGFKAVRALAD